MIHHTFHKAVKYSSLIMIAIILILAGLLFWNFQSTKANSVDDYQLTGWIWSKYYSWVSLNSKNCQNNPSCSENQSYAVRKATTGEIYGWGWSAYLGWVCFGSTCITDATNICNDQPGCNPSAFGTVTPLGGWKISVDNNEAMFGWAKILSMGDQGWISFGGVPSSSLSVYPVCYNCSPACVSWKPSSTPPLCLKFSTSTYDNCKTCFSTGKLDGIPLPLGTSPDLAVVGGSGKLSFNCKGTAGSVCRTVESSISGAKRIECDVCSSTNAFGSGINTEDGSLIGWAWNANAESKDIGGGWFHLNVDYGNAGILYPWLETNYGSIYGKNDIRQKGTLGKTNATYCIFAKDISGVNSGNCDVIGVNLDFPISSSTNVYRNALGKIDVKGLENVLSCTGKTCYNKYGNEIVSATKLGGQLSLDNKVYVSASDLTIGSGLVFDNGAKYGNGTIIVNGNLIINNNFSYVPLGGITDLNRLASAAWIVKGDVIINGNVTSTVGAFVVLGKDGAVLQAESGSLTDDYPKYKKTDYGVVFSSSSNNPLTVYGLLVARAFDFRRTFADPIQGSERIIYDGRIIANPPPGFKGFVEGLPVMKDF
jgi:hypothetical protein